MFLLRYIPFVFLFALTACVGTDLVEDAVDPVLRIGSVSVDTIGFGESLQLEASFFNRVGIAEAADVLWESNRPDILAVNPEGVATALAQGTATVTASVLVEDAVVSDQLTLVAGAETVVVSEPQARIGLIETTSSYELTGGMRLVEDGDGLLVEIDESYRASTALPGLYVYLTNNPRTTRGALEIGAVEVFRGAHRYRVPGATLSEYSHLLYFCKPFNVKVGDGAFEEL